MKRETVKRLKDMVERGPMVLCEVMAADALATDAEVKRLRKVEKLAREFVELAGSNEGTPGPCERALRVALKKPRSTRSKSR